MTTIIDGKAVAKKVNAATQTAVAELEQQGIKPGIAVIIVGEDPASQIYVRNKNRKATKLGMHSVVRQLPVTTTQAELLSIIAEYNSDASIHGILVQSPLPKQINEPLITMAIDPKKDVDGFHPTNMGKLITNFPGNYPVANTPRGIMTLLAEYGIDPAGKQAVVIGRSTIVGKPMAALLTNANATVTVAHSRTKDLKALARTADILVVATGIAHLITGADIKPGATVIDVGMDRDADGKLVGDVDFDSAQGVAGFITPVPGGVGPMTIATLMQTTVELAKWSDLSE
ncbi:bifunctional 5,10-methylenetetrahydrofolate dehydrogenase/5,10-methenyltetrahydrofolate cyclohydrolase [Lactiplantibacillus mudanjiangensis]|uniref:Bifunctional protein FolD n=1 Tax=Lactiplantibacillus mudanjiangensis TaxID=1296538 RepID=A0A660E111_9LACO|nr:tetrahydrofolate dehydrogenase/cyclohydrolase catalytic domain-containing protein [Lactiplantibacillus mudanjiangensis]VDG19819.1 bifunctional protein: methylenetetrahydrofolate dehydrogenase; methenyltetrahydrofolate cyclohydrolase [Lactobacillus plantarum JDM1] [Lactiplantibacillus mudanjiangensis]VDG24500.1 bifunctional protein: methylenetetrahydrofolate dehydrogenase; methenyltetrahydrofolate cyclohydrolase [Lactobacillus plantarum JDM1] [Lactiplantibacillus mudanjiangensis]VDG29791.1 bif